MMGCAFAKLSKAALAHENPTAMRCPAVCSGLKHLEQQGADLSSTEVHIFGLDGGNSPAAHQTATQLILHAEQPAAEFSVSSDDNSTLDDFGASEEEGAAQLVDHTDVADLLPLLFGSGSEGGYGTAQRPWLARLACRLVLQLPRVCRAGPTRGPGAAGVTVGQQGGSTPAPAAADAEWLDFSKWLLSAAKPEDTVVLALDLPTQQQVGSLVRVCRVLLLRSARLCLAV